MAQLWFGLWASNGLNSLP